MAGRSEALPPCGLPERAPPAPWHRRWGKADRRGNLYPAKPRPERKIDAAVALMMAVGRAMAEDGGGTADLDAILDHPVFA